VIGVEPTTATLPRAVSDAAVPDGVVEDGGGGAGRSAGWAGFGRCDGGAPFDWLGSDVGVVAGGVWPPLGVAGTGVESAGGAALTVALSVRSPPDPRAHAANATTKDTGNAKCALTRP
jgi:hypothetical protein